MKMIHVVLSAAICFAGAVETRAEPRPAVVTGLAGSASPNPATVGVQVTFTSSVTGGVNVNYSWDFGDGDPTSPTAFSSSTTAAYTYARPGHYTVTLRSQDLSGPGPQITFKLLVHWPIPATRPTNSSTIILDKMNANRLWCVNPDQDTVAVINTLTNTTIQEIQVGRNPRTLAQAADGTIWVASQQHPSISVIQSVPPYALQHVIPLPHASLPYGICMTPDGSAAYVSLQGSGGVQKFSTTSRALLASSTQPSTARGIAVTSTGRVLVTRFISPQSDPLLNHNSAGFMTGNHGEVVELNAALGVVRTFNLAIDPGPGTSPDPDTAAFPAAGGSRGVPNYLTSLVVTPDGRRAWVPSKKDNVQRGTRTPERDGRTPGAELTYRAIVSSVDLVNNVEPPLVPATIERFDVDNAEMPQAACTSPLGDYLFVALQGNNRIQIRDLYPPTGFTVPATINGLGDFTGTTPPLLPTNALSPQGLVVDSGTSKLYVQNYMSRTVSVFDITSILDGSSSTLPTPAVFATVLAADLLAATVLQGKKVFYNAGDPRMSTNAYVSCAGCHLDGGSDMRVWDFTNRGEGFRNTITLQGRGGTGHGNVHWSANFDEIQDFDNDVYFAFHDGNSPRPFPAVPPSSTFSFTNTPFPSLDLVNNNAGRDADLDALAAYVASLTKVSRSPFRNADGSLTAQGAAGEAVFKAKNCQQCHTGRNFTDSQVGKGAPSIDPVSPPGAGVIILHNVGTLKATSGQRLGGGALPGVDTPTLKGLWQTAPFFHDGHAATMDQVFSDSSALAHFKSALSGSEPADLARYMLEIDELDGPPFPVQANTVTLGGISSGRPYSLATAATGSLPFVDRSYTIATTVLTAPLNGKILLRTAEDDKLNAMTSVITFTLTLSADVYVFYDSRGTTLPSWLTGWTRSATEDLRISPGTTSTGLQMLAYKKNFLAGSVTLGGNLEGGAVGALRNYFVIINQSGSPLFEEGPLAKGEWAHDKDQDGDGLHDEYEALNALNPWAFNSAAATLPDEDKIVTGAVSAFLDQLAFETPAGGGGGCGLGGLEVLIPFAFFRLLRRKGSRRRTG